MYGIEKDLNLKNIIEVDTKPLPDFKEFLLQWIDFLRKNESEASNYLIREAVILSDGISGIEKLACEEGEKFPEAYVDWIAKLEEKKEYRAMLDVSKKGLKKIEKDFLARAEIAKGMVRASEYLEDLDNQLIGWEEAFYSVPSLSYFLSLIEIAEKKGCLQEAIEKVLAGIISRKAVLSERVLSEIYILAGKYDNAFSLYKENLSLGWNSITNPKGLVTTAIVIIPISWATWAATGTDPVPVPPPIPAVRKTISAPSSAMAISPLLSRAAASPTLGSPPAPRPLVNSGPS